MTESMDEVFNYKAIEISKYIFCSTTNVFSIKLENGKTIYHHSADPESFLLWLKKYKIPVIARRN